MDSRDKNFKHVLISKHILTFLDDKREFSDIFSFVKIRAFFKNIGPGFIIAATVLGPGSITVASRIGSEYGYAFLWVIVIATVFMITYTSMAARFGW